MKTFLIQTTTNERWEICGGTYIVYDNNKDDAIAQFNATLQPPEKITTTTELKSKVKNIVCCQQFQIE